MLFQLGALANNPRLFVVVALALAISLLIGLSFHEFCHALAADLLGDRLPRAEGRLTLNPAAHLDPMGALFMVLAGFGWGKPVRFNPFRLRVSPALGVVLVKLAGPLSNFVIAGALAAPIKAGLLQVAPELLLNRWTIENYIGYFLLWVVIINISLGVFNLLPFPPLDGGGIAVILPGPVGDFFRRMESERWGFAVLMLLVFLPTLTGGRVDPIGAVTRPVRGFLIDLFLRG
ncbi:MAG: site-2 protease family protein [Dehalococcoidia bacterium]